jgi:hypothetical protein
MSTLETKKIEPLSGTTVTLGASGDAVTMPAGVTVKTNTVKDAGGNTLWTSNGSGTLSSVNAGLQANTVFISSQTASSSSSISFTSGIDSTYDEYVFYFVNMNPASNAVTFRFQGNASGQSGFNEQMTTTVFTASQYENGSSGQVVYSAGADQANDTNYQRLSDNVGNEADESVSGEFHLYAPSSTVYATHFSSVSNTNADAEYTGQIFMSGYFNVTAAITQIDFKFSSGNIDEGTVYLYGIR